MVFSNCSIEREKNKGYKSRVMLTEDHLRTDEKTNEESVPHNYNFLII